MRFPREFVPSDVNLADDPKILRAGYRAELLFRRGNEFAKRTKSDGEIDTISLPAIGRGIPGKLTDHAAALVREGLWETTQSGWRITSFLRWNPSQEQLEEDRARKRTGAIMSNHKRGRHEEPDKDCPLCMGAPADQSIATPSL